MKLSTQLFVTILSKTTENVSIFILSIVLARYFTKAEYGTYLHVQLIVNIAVWSLLLGIPHSVYYFLPKVRSQRKYLLNVLALMAGISFIVSIGTYFMIPFLSESLLNEDLLNLGGIVLCLILFQIPITSFEPIMISAGEIKLFAKLKSLFSLALFISVIAPISLGMSLEQILKSLVFCFLLQVLVVIYYSLRTAYKYSSPNLEGENCSFNEQARYSLPIGLSSGLSEMSSYADKIIVSNQSSPEDYAVYARGAMDLPIINIIANTLDNLLMPRFIKAFKEKDTPGVITSWHTTIRMMASFIYPCCFFLIATAHLLIPAIFSERYIDSVIIFQIYSLGLLTRISTFSIIVRAIGKTKDILWVSIGTVIGNILLTLLFMSWWGLVGAPIATVLVMLIMKIMYVYSVTHYLKINMIDVFPWMSLLHSLLASTISTLPVLALLSLEINVWLHLLLLSIVFSISYILLTKISLSLTKSDKEAIRSITPKRLKWII